ncbi:MAG TPA: BT4734/BF3469 family protein [Verrucomicrobiae bacterium]|jgi:hypothetical protein|nr:BT4734/BF3469 family protein [Verrucomicrobiae bacterium]
MKTESAAFKARSMTETGQSFLATKVSFGMNLKQPDQLENRTAGDVLNGIRDGEWRGLVERVRTLPLNEQDTAKAELPLVTWSGTFSYRDSRSLIAHSGLVGIDLDDLDSDCTRRVMHTALDDPHCAAAFRSARGAGVRLVVRVPPASAPQHGFVFDAAASHVRCHYKVEPDLHRDVCRASFVSYDGQILINALAVPLPVLLPEMRRWNNTASNRCVKSSSPLEWWVWLARDGLPHESKQDGTAFTHLVLIDLGKRLALRIERECIWRAADNFVELAAHEWFQESRRRGLRLRGTLAEYADELRISVHGAKKKSWFRDAADLWTRWKREPEFPTGDPKAAIVFAVRRHCQETKSRKFFLSCRDAGNIVGINHVRAAQVLNQLCAEKILRRFQGPRPARHAAEFELLSLT